METPSSPGLPRRWREEQPVVARAAPSAPRQRSRTPLILVVVALMIGLLGTLGSLLSWLRPMPSPFFLALGVTAHKNPAIPSLPMVERDLESLCKGDYFTRQIALTAPSQEGRHILHALASLKSLRAKDAVVVYVSAHAVLAGAGKVHILPSDANPDDPTTWISLHDFLEKLRACPARGQLLVLDIMKSADLARLGCLYQDVGSALTAELDAVPDPRRLVLTSCAPGQSTLVSEELARSVFSYYFEEALRGYARGYGADGHRDSQVTVHELSAFVRARVDRWAIKNRGMRQTPLLLGTGNDFALAAFPHGESHEHVQVAPARTYPPQLQQAWDVRDGWWQSGTYRLAPRAFQQAQATLLETEKQWRAGIGDLCLEPCLKLVQKTNHEFVRQRALFQMHPVSLAQEQRAGRKPDPAVVKAVNDLMVHLEHQLNSTPAENVHKLKAKLSADFHDTIKDASAFDLEAAVFTWLLNDPRKDPGMLRFVETLVHRASPPQPRYVETLLLRQLTDLAYRIEGKEWPAPMIGQIVNLAAHGEMAAADPQMLPWTRPSLEEASQARHDAEICLWARGYASLDSVARLAKTALDRYETVLQQENHIRHARLALDEALALLPFYVPYLDIAPEQESHWMQATRASLQLADIFEGAIVGLKNKKNAGTGPEKIADVERLTKLLATALGELKKPFAGVHIADLGKRSLAPESGPELIMDLEGLLSVPSLNMSGSDRAGVWSLTRSIARKLNEETLKLDRDEDQKYVMTSATQPKRDQDVAEEQLSRARRRARTLVSLSELGGLSGEPLERAREALARRDVDSSPQAWCACGAETRHLWPGLLAHVHDETRAGRRVRLEWLAPPLESIKALDETSVSASALVRFQEARAQWAFLGEQYRYQSRDYQGLGLPGAGPSAAQKFYAAAAAANHDLVRLGPEVYAAVQGVEPMTPLASNPVFGVLEIKRVVPPGSFGPLDVALTFPDPAWLHITPAAVHLPAIFDSDQARELKSKVAVQVGLRPNAERSLASRPVGFLAEARFEGRHFHSLVAVPLQARPREVQILIGADASRPDDKIGDELRLRPSKIRQPYYVYLRNFTSTTRKLTLEMLDGQEPLGKASATLGPEETKRVALGESALPRTGVIEMAGPLVLRVTDAKTTNVLDQRQFRLEIAHPRDYVRVTDIQYDPTDLKGKNKLTVRLQARVPLPGPGIPAELVLSARGIPGFLGVDAGTFKQNLPAEPDAPASTLLAEGIRLVEGADGTAAVYLHVDGMERAFLYKTTLARAGEALTPRPDHQPAVRWNVPRFVPAGVKVPFPIEVDNAPVHSSLEVSLGRGTGDNFEPDLVTNFPQAKQRHIGLLPQGKDGAMLLEAGSADWSIFWNTSHIVGPRLLRARLVDAQGRELATASQSVTIDGDPPNIARIVDVPSKIKRGSPLELHAQGKDPESGIAQVVFFLGKPQEEKIPANTPTVAAIPIDGNKTAWSARFQLPEDKKGLTAITAQFTNGVGMVRYHTATLELTETEPALGPGLIRGKVREGPRPQAGLEVLLRDDKGNELSRTRTQSDGTFLFENLAPGNYVIFCVKPDSLRKATEPARVEPNRTAFKNLNLSL